MQLDERPETEEVVLVDADDRQTGTAGKMAAHRQGALHRAFSVIIWNRAGEVLLQRRALSKYHSGGLWTNACCGHPRPGEVVAAAASRRLGEEMGFSCPLEEFGTITYRAELDQGLVEHEFVHVFRGTFDGAMELNPDEVSEIRWMTPDALLAAFDATPEIFTAWFVKYMRAGWPLDRPAVAS
jgi:isopentenyl-diphosphate delta-isomerase